jgi:hypothetical protein
VSVHVARELHIDVLGLPPYEDDLLFAVPSAAAWKLRIVSSGLSIRGRVGFDLSGSPEQQSVKCIIILDLELLTNKIALLILPLHQSQVVKVTMLLCDLACNVVSMLLESLSTNARAYLG